MTGIPSGPARAGRVTLWLGLGIFFLPYVFAWFTLKEGYTTPTRLISFGWLAWVLIVVGIGMHSGPPSSPVTGQPAATASPQVATQTFTPAERASALAPLRVETDQVEGTHWYYDRTTDRDLGSNGLYAYIGRTGSDPPDLRMVIRYAGSDWLFFNQVTVKADDQKFDWLVVNVQRHVGYGHVSEWLDVEVAPTQMNMLQAVSRARHVIVRLTGPQFKKDRIVGPREKAAIKHVIYAYRTMGGPPI